MGLSVTKPSLLAMLRLALNRCSMAFLFRKGVTGNQNRGGRRASLAGFPLSG